MADTLALSFLQPWLWLMMEGYKDTENRSQRPFAKAIGQRIAMHASKGWDAEAVQFARELVSAEVAQRAAAAPRGVVVGSALLAGAVKVVATDDTMERLRAVEVVGDLSDEQVARVLRSRWTFGEWGLVFEDRRKVPVPIPARGALGFWKVPADLAERLEVPRG